MIKVVTGRIRMAYVNLFNPKAVEQGEARYSLCVLIPKTDRETVDKINSAVEAAKKAGASLWRAKDLGSLKTPLRDGDEERPEEEAFRGHYYLNAYSRRKPEVVGRSLEAITDEKEVYSGCYGKVSLSFYAYNKAGNKGVGCGLLNVQKLEDGQAFEAGSRAEEDFQIEGEGKLW